MNPDNLLIVSIRVMINDVIAYGVNIFLTNYLVRICCNFPVNFDGSIKIDIFVGQTQIFSGTK